jgi:NAD(P)-dependent dehydrogenase (short-subunit alcohol dehydrogenase family)
MSRKVAIITGGGKHLHPPPRPPMPNKFIASGIGLGVATRLAATNAWDIIILDLNQVAGEVAAVSLKSTTFICTDVNDYTSLSFAFHKTFTSHGSQLDFVFANAGIAEKDSFYSTGSSNASSPPPPPNMLPIDIDLKSVVHTTWLAQHYIRLNQHRKGGVLTMTASAGGLYALPLFPLYAAAKHGVLGLMRSIAKPFYENDGIRVNAICPGKVRTNLFSNEAWDKMGTDFTPTERIVEAVMMLLGDEGLWGKAVEVSGENGRWFREQPEYMDPKMRKLLG